MSGFDIPDGHACQDCSWCHDFWYFGYCDNPNIDKRKLTYEELVTDNDCEGFTREWMGG